MEEEETRRGDMTEMKEENYGKKEMLVDENSGKMR